MVTVPDSHIANAMKKDDDIDIKEEKPPKLNPFQRNGWKEFSTNSKVAFTLPETLGLFS